MIVFDRRHHTTWMRRVLLGLPSEHEATADRLRVVVNTEEQVMPAEVRDALRTSIRYLDPPI